MAYPVYEGNGGIGTGTDYSADLPLPSTVNEWDILFAEVMDADDDGFDLPDGWQRFQEHKTSSNLSVALYWYRADGTETGSVTFTSFLNAGSLVAGIIHRYSGCKRYGVPFEGWDNGGLVLNTSHTIVVSGSPLTLGTERLAVGLCIVEDNTINSFTGSGWTEDSRLSTSVGNDAHFAMASYPLPNINSRPGANAVWGFSSNEYAWVGMLFLIPEGDVPVTLNTPADLEDIGDDTTPTVEFTPNAVSDLDNEVEVQFDTVNTFDSQGDSKIVIDSYDGGSLSQYNYFLNSIHGKGQSFSATVTGFLVSTVFVLDKDNLATGFVKAKLYSHSGTFGTSSIGVDLLATSDFIDVSTIGSAPSDVEFFFTDHNQYELVNGEKYVMMIYYEDSTASNNLNIGIDNTSPTHSGNSVEAGLDRIPDDFDASVDIDFTVYVDTSFPLIDALSETDAGFLNTVSGGDTHPFNDNEKLSYTVQGGEELPYGTVYWRARAINPTGINVFDDWSAVRSFDITEDTGAVAGSADIVTSSVVTADADLQLAIDLDITTGSVVTANIKVKYQISSDIVTSSVVTADIKKMLSLSADIVTSSILVTEAVVQKSLASNILPSSVVDVDVNIKYQADADVVTSSSLDVDVNQKLSLSSDIITSSTLDAGVKKMLQGSADITTGSTLDTDASIKYSLSADLLPSSVVGVDIKRKVELSADLVTGSALSADATVSGALLNIDADIATSSSLSVDLTRKYLLSADVVTSSTVGAEIKRKVQLDADVVTGSTLDTTLKRKAQLSTDIVTSSIVSAGLETDKTASANIVTSSTLDVEAKVKKQLSSDIVTGSTLDTDADITGLLSISADIITGSVINAEVDIKYQASSDIVTGSTVTADLKRKLQLNTDIVTSSILDVNAEVKKKLSADIVTSSTLDTDIDVKYSLNADLLPNSVFDAGIDIKYSLSSDISTSSTLDTEIKRKVITSGDIVTSSLLDAEVKRKVQLEVDIVTASTLDADITIISVGTTQLSADIVTSSVVDVNIVLKTDTELIAFDSTITKKISFDSTITEKISFNSKLF